MSGREHASGRRGEVTAEQLLQWEGWEIVERQPVIYGHKLDFLAKHPHWGEAFIEVKVWRDPRAVGTDNIKKAYADAWDLQAAYAEAGVPAEQRIPYILLLSHAPVGLYLDQALRAMRGGAIHEIRILGTQLLGEVDTAS